MPTPPPDMTWSRDGLYIVTWWYHGITWWVALGLYAESAYPCSPGRDQEKSHGVLYFLPRLGETQRFICTNKCNNRKHLCAVGGSTKKHLRYYSQKQHTCTHVLNHLYNDALSSASMLMNTILLCMEYRTSKTFQIFIPPLCKKIRSTPKMHSCELTCTNHQGEKDLYRPGCFVGPNCHDRIFHRLVAQSVHTGGEEIQRTCKRQATLRYCRWIDSSLLFTTLFRFFPPNEAKARLLFLAELLLWET